MKFLSLDFNNLIFFAFVIDRSVNRLRSRSAHLCKVFSTTCASYFQNIRSRSSRVERRSI